MIPAPYKAAVALGVRERQPKQHQNKLLQEENGE